MSKRRKEASASQWNQFYPVVFEHTKNGLQHTHRNFYFLWPFVFGFSKETKRFTCTDSKDILQLTCTIKMYRKRVNGMNCVELCCGAII